MTPAEQVARALREPTMFPGHLSPRVIERCAALAEFVEAADDVRGLAGFHAAFPKHALTAYDAAIKRLAEVLR